MSAVGDAWGVGPAYETYIGRWSRLVAAEFVEWLAVPPGRRWLDVGCGTGALTATIVERCAPAGVVGVDPSPGFVRSAAAALAGTGARFEVADAAHPPAGQFDVVVSGLVMNFVPDLDAALRAQAGAAPGGTVAAYVWDYAGRMDMLRHFWDAAIELDPGARALDEGMRFPVCRPDRLAAAWRSAGLREVETRPIDIAAAFAGFNDLWEPFLGGQGPAPGYVASLDGARRDALAERLRLRLPVAPDGSIRLLARAWAVRGRAVDAS